MMQVPTYPNPYMVQPQQPKYNAVNIDIQNPSITTPGMGQPMAPQFSAPVVTQPQYATPTMPYYTYPQAPIYNYPPAQSAPYYMPPSQPPVCTKKRNLAPKLRHRSLKCNSSLSFSSATISSLFSS